MVGNGPVEPNQPRINLSAPLMRTHSIKALVEPSPEPHCNLKAFLGEWTSVSVHVLQEASLLAP